jgi:large subunit ribosomal protein L24
MGNRLKKDDLVQVVAGRDKGKQGRILKVLEEGRVLVEGVNVMKRHQSPKKFKEAGIIEKEAPIDASNVMIVDPQTNTPTRVRAGEKDGKKVRVAVKSGAVLD